MKDFFGRKLGGWVYNALAHLSPIDLRGAELAGKISTSYANEGSVAAGSQIFSAIKGAMGNRGDYSFGRWATGQNIGEQTVSDSIRRARIGMRLGVPAAMGLGTLSGFVAPDNPLQNTVRAGATLGLAGAAAGFAGNRMGWGAGAAIAGFTGFNMLRPGDNAGPF